jgi:uncharacterized repeat protein (TIGR01451 family)
MERLEVRQLLSVDISAVGQGYARHVFDDNGVLVSGLVTYQVMIFNYGDAEPVVLTEALDDRFEFSGSHVTGYDGSFYDGPYTESYDEDAGVYSVTFPSLKGAIVRIEGLVHPSSTGIPGPPLTNDYSITTADENVNPQTGGSIPVDAPGPIADLALTYTGGETPIQGGSEVVYTFVATNHSSVETAPGAMILVGLSGDSQEDATGLPTDRNPGWIEDQEWPGGAIPGPGLPGTSPYFRGLSFDLGDLGPGESRTVTLALKPSLPAGPSPTLAFPAVLTSDDYDTDAANNVVDVATPFVPETEIRIDPPESNPSAVWVGEDLTYTYQIANLGPNPGTGLVVYQALPAGATFVSAMLNGAPVAGSVAGGTLTMTLPDQGASGPRGDLVVTLGTGGMNVSTGETLSGPFLATWNENPDGVRGEAVMGVVTPRGALRIAMAANAPDVTASGPHATINKPLGVVFTATNPNPTDARDVVVALTLPPESQLGIIPGAYHVERTATAQVVTFRLDVLPAGASHAFEVFTVPLAAVGGSIRATGTIVESGRPASDYAPLSLIVDAQGWSYIDVRRLDAPDGILRFSVTNYGTSTAVGINVDVGDLSLGGDLVLHAPTRDGVPLDGVHSLTPLPSHYPSNFDNGPPYRLWTGDLAPGESTVFEATNYWAGPSHSPYGWVEDAYSRIYPNRTSTGPSVDPPATLPLDVVAQMTTDATSVQVGGEATFVATVTNIGPFDGEGLIVHATIPETARLVSAPPGSTFADGVLSFRIDHLPVGMTETLRFVVSPTPDALAQGSLASTLNVEAAQPFLNPYLAVTGAAVGVTAGPAGTASLGAGSYVVDDDAGALTIPVGRVGGASGPLTVGYVVEGIDAVAGVDFTPVSGTLAFADGVAAQAIIVPVLANPNARGDRSARVVLSNGDSAVITIRATTAPAVSAVSWAGPPRAITSITVTFAGALAEGTAFRASDFVLATPGRDLRFGTRDDGRATIAAASYDPSTSTLTLTPTRPLPANVFYRFTISGLTGANGASTAPYTATLARGTNLRYITEAGSRVSLRLGGGGWLDDLLDGSNSGVRLAVVNPTRRRPSLSGGVFRGASKRPMVDLGRILGAESARVRLPSPPFVFDAPLIEPPPAAPRRPRSAWATRQRSIT